VTRFEEALEFALKWETGGDPDGGYHLNPKDPGGETKWGIARNSYVNLSIRLLTRHAAADIYRKDFWLANKCEKLRWPLALVHFDACVNLGNFKVINAKRQYHYRANRILQRAIGVKEDGLIGPVTLAKAYEADQTVSSVASIAQRNLWYVELAQRSPVGMGSFFGGWLNRTQELQGIVLKARKSKR